jgi:hypothetical protein
MKQRVLKAALRIVNAVMAAGLVGMVCAMFAAGIGWGVGWVDDWRVPVRMFGGTMFALVALALWGNHILKPGLEALKGDES